MRYTKEVIHNIALRYKHKCEFDQGSHTAYVLAHSRGWIDEVCSHMTPVHMPNGFWTRERIIAAALKCDTITQMHKEYAGAAPTARKNGMYPMLKKHFRLLKKKTNGKGDGRYKRQ